MSKSIGYQFIGGEVDFQVEYSYYWYVFVQMLLGFFGILCIIYFVVGSYKEYIIVGIGIDVDIVDG